MESNVFNLAVERLLRTRQFIVFELFPGQFQCLSSYGASLKGAVVVTPYTDQEHLFLEHNSYPTLLIKSLTENIFELVVKYYTRSVSQYSGIILNFLNEIDPDRKCEIISYLPLDGEFLKKTDRKVIVPDSKKTNWLEDKRNFLKLMNKFSLPVLKSERMSWPLTLKKWENLCQKFNSESLVFQELGIFGGGRTTMVFHSYSEAHQVLSKTYLAHSIYTISPYVGNQSYNVLLNVLPLPNGDCRIWDFPISRQQIQINEKGKMLYAGNYFNQFFDNDLENRLYDAFHTLAVGLNKDYDYFGPLGLDFLIDQNNDFYIVDLNPRINGVFSSLSNWFDKKHNSSLLALVYSLLNDKKLISQLETLFSKEIKNEPFSRIYMYKEVISDFSYQPFMQKGIYTISGVGSRLSLKFLRGADSYSEIQNPYSEIFFAPSMSDSYQKGQVVMIGDAYIREPLAGYLSVGNSNSGCKEITDTFARHAGLPLSKLL